MTDVPLPEAILSERQLEANLSLLTELASLPRPTFAKERIYESHEALRALAFRDESGHRVVWSAEKVAPLIDALDRIETLTAITIDVSRNPHGRLRTIRDAARAALARIRGPEPALVIGALSESDGHPAPEWTERCPTCGSDDPTMPLRRCKRHDRWLAANEVHETNPMGRFGRPMMFHVDCGDSADGPCANTWHRGPEPAEDSDD